VRKALAHCGPRVATVGTAIAIVARTACHLGTMRQTLAAAQAIDLPSSDRIRYLL